MGGLSGALFGKKGTPSQIVDVTPQEFSQLAFPVSQQLSGLLNMGGGPQFLGPLTAPMTQQEGQLLDQIFQSVQRPGPGTTAAMPLLQNILSGRLMDPSANPFLQASVEAAQRPIIQQFQEQVMPRLQAQFTRAGQFIQPQGSSPFDRAAAISSRGLADALGDVSTQMFAQNFEAERARQLPAAQMAAGFDQQELNRALQGMQAAALPRMIQDLGVERGLQEFQRRVQVLLQALGIAGTLARPQTQTLPGTPGAPGLLSGLAGGAGMALGARIPLPF